MAALTFKETAIHGVLVVDTDRFEDARGVFARLFCERELDPVLAGRRIVQINRSITSRAGAIRGLHFQNRPHAEMKFVRCLHGRVLDVAVDLRRNSPTFLRHHAEELSDANFRMLIIPEGCAHGFQVLQPNSELLYLHTAAYSPASEGGVRYNDPAIGISWPREATDISERDRSHPLLTNSFPGLDYEMSTLQ